MPVWHCPHCNYEFCSVLVKIAERWMEEEGRCPKCAVPESVLP